MHFALPPRKTSQRPPYLPRTSRLPGLRRSRAKVVALAGLFFFAVVYLLTRRSSSRYAPPAPRAPRGNPPVVLVTVLDESKYSTAYLETVKENRMLYAEKHGYKTFFAKVGDYDLGDAPGSWTTVVALRDALTKFPDCAYVWHLDASGFVMNPHLKIQEHVMKPARLDELMRKDVPVAPPDGIIKTFSHLKGKDVELVLTQDKEGLSAGSLIVRNGEWARFFLETWFGPLNRSYNFQKAEEHALEHVVQWHPTILSRMAIVDQRVMSAYSKGESAGEYKDGDLAVRFPKCAAAGKEACESESQVFVQAWRRAFASS